MRISKAMSNRLMASLSRRGSRCSVFEPSSKPQLVVVASNSATDALRGRVDRLREANRSMSEAGALARVYGNPANRRLVLEAIYG
jgi:hypothetical protein